MKKQILIPLVVLALLMGSFACNKGAKSPIVGKWKIVEATGTMAQINIGTMYIFRSNGKMRISKGILKTNATYTLQGNDLTIAYTNNMKMQAKVTIEGDKMTYELAGGNQKFIMQRQ